MNNEYLERNYQIIREKMIEEMELALEFGKQLVESELDAGILDFVIKPIIKSFYSYWSAHDAKVGTLEQIRVTMDCAKRLVVNGNTQEKFSKEIEENFPIYLENDQTFKQCKKNHKNFEKLIEVNKEAFITQVQDAVYLLKTDDDIKDYDELIRAAFKTKAQAFESLMRQLEFNDRAIKIVEKDKSILKIPTGKHIIVKVLRKGFIQTKEYLLERLDNIYNT
ncbi:MAG: hypothetical protein EU539_04680 [Promethearchaeota archaeon]|nr:MAG: hypothetical protein EU539_04680 [Candidatus Lokiarchaeota archaeon]